MNGVPPEKSKNSRRAEKTQRKSTAGNACGKGQTMYIKTMENRKDLVKRIEQLTGERAVYTRMPECAFEIGEFKVERYGSLVFTEEADTEVIDTLLAEGLIKPNEPEETEEDNAEPQETEEPEPVEVNISLPMANHTAASLRNLTSMIRARGNLISKATGGRFSCTAEVMEALTPVTDIPAFLTVLKANPGALEGLEFTEDVVTFTGFPETDRPDHIHTFTALASLMNRMALEQKHTLARPVTAENEKYSLRVWLISLGMKGEEYKTARRILLAPLSGNAAFKDEAMQNRWKEKQKAKRATVNNTAEENLSNTEENTDTEVDGATAEPVENTVISESDAME